MDFYCAKAGLVIELDGSQHYTEEMKATDRKREEDLHTFGLDILRFSNADIDRYFDSVCQMIDQTIQLRLKEGTKL